MIGWHRFKRDVPSFLDKPVEEKKEGLVPINMVKQPDRYNEEVKVEVPIQPFVPELSEEDILNLEKEIQKEEKKEKKVKKVLDKKKKNV